MISIADFYPTQIQQPATAQERAQLDTDAVGSSVLLLDLPLRYVFEYALNHLQRTNNNSSNTLEPTSHNNNNNNNNKEATVLIVTDSRSTLRECMRQEQQICKELYNLSNSSRQARQEHATTATNQPQQQEESDEEEEKEDEELEVKTNPWAHLWPPPRPLPSEEYSTETPPPLSQSAISRSGSSEWHHYHGQETIDDPSLSSSSSSSSLLLSSFRPDLWARIQIRYAPTICHVLSLFRCLHLSPGLTHGKTFGPDDITAEDVFEAVVPLSPSTINTGGEAGGGGRGESTTSPPLSPTPPTLVILLGCFGRDRSLEIRRFSMSDIVPTFADLRTFDEREYMIGPQRVVDEEGGGEIGGAGLASQGGIVGRAGGARRGYDTSGCARDARQSDEVMVEASDNGDEEEEEEGKKLDDEELGELEYAEYIRMVANTIAEIKDCLAWLERSSGRKPELLIVENTTAAVSHPFSSRTTTTTHQQQLQQTIMPTVRELWLQIVMGYWVDSIIKTERSSIVQQNSTREVYKLWVRTQESLNAAFTTPTTPTTQMQAMGISDQRSEEVYSSSGTTTTTAALASVAASMGAVLGVQWYFDSTGDGFHFEVIT